MKQYGIPVLWSGRDGSLVVAAALMTLLLMAYYVFSSRFGLYSDDVFLYSLVLQHSNHIFTEAFDFSKGYAGGGRPLGQVAILLLYALGNGIKGVEGLYLLGGLVLLAQTLLAFLCLRKFTSGWIAFVAATGYTLFPADVARFLPVHALDSQISAVAFWASLLFFLRERYIVSTLIILSTLFLYETHWLLALGFPLLLLGKWVEDKKIFYKRASYYWLVFLAFSTMVVTWRLVFSPGRASQHFHDGSHLDTILRILESIGYGAYSSASSLVHRPLDFIVNANPAAWIIAGASFWILYFLVAYLRSHTRQFDLVDKEKTIGMIRAVSLIAFGLFAVLAAYPLFGIYTDRFPPIQLAGRLSNVHAAAGAGYALLFAGLLTLLERKIAGLRQMAQMVMIISCVSYVAMLVGFYVVNQQRYVENWEYQKSFLRALPSVVPELDGKKLVVVKGADAENAKREELVIDWSLPYLPALFWNLPRKWNGTPMILEENMFKLYGSVADGIVSVKGYPTLSTRHFNISDVVFVELIGGRLYRSFSSIKIHGGLVKGAEINIPVSSEFLSERGLLP